MPVESALWRLTDQPVLLSSTGLNREDRLHQWILQDISLIDERLMVIGSEVSPPFSRDRLDILAIDSQGYLTIIELKRDKTPREVIVQALDYASWVCKLTYDDLKTIYARYCETSPVMDKISGDLRQDWETRFGKPLEGNALNEKHQILIVASKLDDTTERVLQYLLSQYQLPINTVFFRFYRYEEREYLSRTWLASPQMVEQQQERLPSKKVVEHWNGRDWFFNIGHNPEEGKRIWDDSREFGFLSAGNGSQEQIKSIMPGARVFAYQSGRTGAIGYVGVGIVEAPAVPITEFRLKTETVETTLRDVPLQAANMYHEEADLRQCEWIVSIHWLKTVPLGNGYWEKGLFYSPGTCCRLYRSDTIGKVCQHYGLPLDPEEAVMA